MYSRTDGRTDRQTEWTHSSVAGKVQVRHCLPLKIHMYVHFISLIQEMNTSTSKINRHKFEFYFDNKNKLYLDLFF